MVRSTGCPSHLKKRKLDIIEPLNTISVSSNKYNKSDTHDKNLINEEDSSTSKKRKKSNTSSNILEEKEEKQIPLPQKKRVIPTQQISDNNTNSNNNKKQKSQVEEDDETLIRETEAALKSLSGSWPGPRGSSYSKEINEQSPFENLFEEKKAKLSPTCSNNSSSSTDNSCSLKDVITLRDNHGEEKSCSSKEDDR